MVTMVRGQKIKLSDVTSSISLRTGVFADMPVGMTVDVSCFGVDADNKLSDDRYLIFYNQNVSPCNAIKMLGAVNGDHEQFEINLSCLPSAIKKLVLVITIDGDGLMSQLNNGYLRLLDGSKEIMRFSFSGKDFDKEKAIIVGEIYLKDVWRLSAVGQGFNGGLSVLLKYFGGEEITPAPAPAPARISLEKRLEKDAPHLIGLAKTLTISLEKKKLVDTVAKVALILDVSGSMSNQYSNGDMQLVVDRVVPLAVHFDDDGDLEAWAFGSRDKSLAPITVKNVKNYVNHEWGGWSKWMSSLGYGNNEPAVMLSVVDAYKKSKLPAYVIFISDGGVGYNDQIEKILVESSKYPIFWQFVGLGGSNYGILERFDTMKGRVVDNCNFFALDDIHSVSNSDLYERLLGEFPDWLKAAKSKGIL